MAPKKRAQWSEEDLVTAVRAVQRKILSTYGAAERYKIPRRTIRNHLKSGNLKKSLGRKSILSQEQEADLVERIIRFAEIGLPITPRILRRQVYKFCEKNNIKTNFNTATKLAGKDWLKMFLKRNPSISKRKAQFMNPARAQKLNKFIVKDHFATVSKVYEELDLKNHPERIYNMDEKGCRLTVHHQQSVLAQKGAKRVHLQAPEHAESVTIAGCVNTVGAAIPPMIILKGKRLKPEMYDNLPAGTSVQKSTKGYMTNDLFIEFLNHLAKYKTAGKCLLIFDGAACHLDLSIVEVADKLDIVLYCLPSNTTHELQPLDKAVYRSFEHYWDVELLLYLDQHPDRKLTKPRFNIILSKVWSKCMTYDNITSGFRATGLYPFNPDAIPETAFAPSTLTEVPMCVNEDASNVGVNKPSVSNASSASKENIVPSSTQRSQLPRSNSPIPSTSTGILDVTSGRPRTGRDIYRTIYSSDSDEDDDFPLSQFKSGPRMSFQKLMPTPNMKLRKMVSQRRKAINYKGTKVTKDLFNDNEKQAKAVDSKSKKNAKKTVEETGWYCYGCGEDKVADMRKCCKCQKWYHEECVGLSIEDKDDFECPDGCY